MREEVGQFLAAMRVGESERRQFERIPGNDLPVELQPRGGEACAAKLVDVARGGALFATTVRLPAGTELEIALPGLPPIAARVARLEPGRIGVDFRQDAASLERISRLLARLAPPAAREAA
jgi:hypothetical protein